MSRWRAERGATKWMRAGLVLGLVLAGLACPRHAAAQSAPVLRALAELRNALDGVYGDEGELVARRLDELAAAGEAWDRTIREAEQRLRAQAGATPDNASVAHEALGTAYLERGRLAEAAAEFEAAVRLAPTRATPHVWRAFALDAMGSTDRAATAFRQAWTLDPDNPATAYLVVARDAIDAADRPRAREALMRAIQGAIRGARSSTPAPFPQTVLAATHAAGSPVFAPARYADGFARAARGEVTDAVARLRAAAANDPLIVDPVARTDVFRQATAALRKGSLRDARAALEQAVAAAPRSSEAHRVLATAAAIGGDSQAAIRHLETALRLRPDDERSWLALAAVRAETGPIDAVVATLERAIAASPESGALRWRLAGALARADRGGDALERYSEAAGLRLLSGQAPVDQAVTTLAMLQQDLPRATAAADRRVRGSLNDAAAHRELASVQAKQGSHEDALAELAIAAWLDPDDPMTFVAIGHGLMTERRDQDAVAALERAVMLQPDLREARYALAQALTRASRRDEARQHLLEFERQRADAIAREQRALDVAAAKSEAVRASAAGQHRQAVQIWERVVALEPGVAQNYLELAEALVRSGALAQSLQHFVKTADMDGVAEVHLRLADVLARLGRARESRLARETYERLRIEDFRRRSGRTGDLD